jgi:hypothetical protein
MYERIIYDGCTLIQLAKDMNDRGIPTRFKQGFWTAATIYQMIRSPVYKGEFYAHRVMIVRTGEFNEEGKPKQRSSIRPENEWIKVECPAIATPEEWDMAQEVMKRNAKKSSKNYRKRNWLVAGLLKCEHCRENRYLRGCHWQHQKESENVLQVLVFFIRAGTQSWHTVPLTVRGCRRT